MKRTIFELTVFSLIITLSGITIADDFSLKSDNELFGMREQIRTMDDVTNDAYRVERQSRMMNMESSQRESRYGDMGASGKKNMDRMSQNNGSHKRDGSGAGKQYGKGKSGQSSGGNQYRYGQNNGSSGNGSDVRYGRGR